MGTFPLQAKTCSSAPPSHPAESSDIPGKFRYIVTCRPISRQRPKYEHATTEPVSQELFSMWFAISIARYRSKKHAFSTTEESVFLGVRAEELS
jgi:hypothetical protein